MGNVINPILAPISKKVPSELEKHEAHGFTSFGLSGRGDT